jgi:arabinose-5-phosphate isomerase
MVTPEDVFVALSYSGEAAELLTLVPVLKREATPLVALTGASGSTLARHADVHLDCRVDREACPLNLAPTSSTTAMLALGDALAVACLDARGFGPADFARSHPGGALGRRLLIRVADVMRTGPAVPRVGRNVSVMQAVHEISDKQMGMTAVVDDDRVVGIFTDGDLRRLLERVGDVRAITLDQVMNASPLTIDPQALAIEAAQLLDARHRNQLLVVEPDGRLAGALHMQDLLAAKVL